MSTDNNGDDEFGSDDDNIVGALACAATTTSNNNNHNNQASSDNDGAAAVSDRADARARRRSRLEQKKISSNLSDNSNDDNRKSSRRDLSSSTTEIHVTPTDLADRMTTSGGVNNAEIHLTPADLSSSSLSKQKDEANNGSNDSHPPPRDGGGDLKLSYSRPSEVPESGERQLSDKETLSKLMNTNDKNTQQQDEKGQLRLSYSTPSQVPESGNNKEMEEEKNRVAVGVGAVGVQSSPFTTSKKEENNNDSTRGGNNLRLSYSTPSEVPESGGASNVDDEERGLNTPYDHSMVAAANNPSPQQRLPSVDERMVRNINNELPATAAAATTTEGGGEEADLAAHVVSAVLINEDAMREQHNREARERILENTAMATVVDKDEEGSGCIQRPSRFFCIICLVLIVIVVVIFLVLLLFRENMPPPQSEQPSQSPTVVKEIFLEEVLIQNLGQYIHDINTTNVNFLNTMDWILYDDPTELVIREMSEVQLVERFVVVLLYFSTNGTIWTNQLDFLSGNSVCDWADRTLETDSIGHGLSCNGNGRIRSINLDANSLFGTIPSELSFLQDLEDFSLSENRIVGPMASELGHLSNLETLNLKQNEITGSVPLQLTLNPNLKIIDLSSNEFDGRIPEFRLRTAVASIDLSHNFFEGTIPSSLTFLAALKNLNLEHNQLSGGLPTRLGLLGDLEFLSLRGNKISGMIPSEIGNLENVQALQLGSNMLSRTLPTQLGNLRSLVDLIFDDNECSGGVPSELGRLATYGRIKSIQLSENILSSTIPSELGFLTTLTSLGLSQNLLTGALPRSFQQFSVDTRITLDGNSLVDNFDKFVCEWDLLVTSADCEEVECGCCPICCTDDAFPPGLCEVDSDLTCFQETKQIVGHSRESWGTECQCFTGDRSFLGDNGIGYRCSDLTCEACNANGDVCVQNSEFSASILFEGTYDVTMGYVRGRNETIQYSRNFPGDPDFCSVTIDGVECEFCNFLTCADGSEVHKVNCDFLDGGNYDGCRDTSFGGSALEVFYIFDYGTSQTCPPRLQPYVGWYYA